MDLLSPGNMEFVERCVVTETTVGGARALVLDNGVLRVSVLPGYGGRLCSLFHRASGRELLATEFLHTVHRDLAVRGGWCAAFPSLLADGESLARTVWDVADVTQDERCAAVRLRCMVGQTWYEADGQVRTMPGPVEVERTISVRTGEAAITVEDSLTNRATHPLPAVWSAMVALRAEDGDRVIAPTETVEVQNGAGPAGAEIEFGRLLSTPYQALARNLTAGCLTFQPGGAPVDVRLTFPREVLPHAAIAAQRDALHPEGNCFRLQPMATTGPVAVAEREGALVLPPRVPLRIALRMEVAPARGSIGARGGAGAETARAIMETAVGVGRLALWRISRVGCALRARNAAVLLLPEAPEGRTFGPGDWPPVDIVACGEVPDEATRRALAGRTGGLFLGPPALRAALIADGLSAERAVALTPGARYDAAGVALLAVPARGMGGGERLGYIAQVEGLNVYHVGRTEYLGEFGQLGSAARPHLVFLTLDEMSLSDALHAARQLQPRVVVPLGEPDVEEAYVERCRAQHMAFEVVRIPIGEGKTFDGRLLTALCSGRSGSLFGNAAGGMGGA